MSDSQIGEKITDEQFENVNRKTLDVDAGSIQDEDREPELHFTTWIVPVAAAINYWASVMFVLSVGFWASAVVGSVGGAKVSLWFAQAWTPGCAILAPPFARIGDKVGRRYIWLISSLLGFIAAILVATAHSIGQCIAGTAVFGVCFANCANYFAAPAEVLPRRHRGTAALVVQSGGYLGVTSGLLIGAGFITHNPGSIEGWRSLFYFIAAAHMLVFALVLWAYHPPPPPNPDNLTVMQRVLDFDAIGSTLLLVSLLPLMMGLIWGGATYPWNSAAVISCLVIGCVFAVVFAVYEAYGTTEGLLAHGMFQSRNTALCLFGIGVEGYVYQTFNDYYGAQTAYLYETRPLFNALRFAVFPLAALFAGSIYIFISYRYRMLKEQLIVGFFLFLVGIICLATLGVNGEKLIIVYICICGLGFASPISCLLSVAQLSMDPKYNGQITGLMISMRSLGGAVGPAVGAAIFSSKLTAALPKYLANSAIASGLPATSIVPFVTAMASSDVTAAESIPGVTPAIIAAAAHAAKEAYAHSFHYLWAAVAPFVLVSLICVICLKNVRKQMNYLVDRPVETIHHKDGHHHEASA